MSFLLKKSKGQLLYNLKNKLKGFTIPETKIYKIINWKKENKIIIKDIQKSFKKYKYIAIRSSSENEDTFESSNAGVFLSELNVSPKNPKIIKKKIENVLSSYNESKKLNKEILVQEMIQNINMSGVIFTFNHENLSPYYTINYDDVTGNTSSITSGNTEFSNKSIYIFRKSKNYIKSKRFKKLINSTIELEDFLKFNFLDIEFCLTKKMQLYLLQVRPIAKINKLRKINIKDFENNLNKVKKKINKKLPTKKGIYGTHNIFGQMPDWNPAEIIGEYPRPLAYSVYKKLITDNTWSIARELMGYRKLVYKKLMFSLARQPYIDTRLSFNSFLPNNLKTKIGKKLVSFWIDKLKNKPFLHDKIESEIAITCFSFDFIKKLSGSPLNKKEKTIFHKVSKKMFIEYFNEKNPGSISFNLNKLKNLENKQFNYNLNKININEIINDCIQYGCIPFSIFARHAFIAMSILNSLEKMKILSKTDKDNFLGSIRTISTNIIEDNNKLLKKKITKYSFLKKYGHLRPGTYDICSKSFNELNYFNKNINLNNKKKINKFKFNNRILIKIGKLLKKENINILTLELLDYIKKSISLREYSKFIFTKNLSILLNKIILDGKKIRLNRENLSYLDINDCLNLKSNKLKKYKKIIKDNKLKNMEFQNVKLPQIIYHESAAFIVPFQTNRPNYITNKKVKSNIFVVDTKLNNELNIKLNNKIIAIENADPGYDWLFSYKISGLITKFGGINSHMAIRCREFNLPAVIGCGEYLYNKIINQNEITLDCKFNKIDFLGIQ